MALFSFPDRVNEYAARIVAGSVVILLCASAIVRVPWIFPVLAVGFLLRVGWGPRFSPLARLAMASAPRLGLVKPVAGPPKRFAQGIGAACMLAASALWLSGHLSAAWAVAGMVITFAFLEASVAFCMGCWIYGRLQRAGVFPAEVCVDCGPGQRGAKT